MAADRSGTPRESRVWATSRAGSIPNRTAKAMVRTLCDLVMVSSASKKLRVAYG